MLSNLSEWHCLIPTKSSSSSSYYLFLVFWVNTLIKWTICIQPWLFPVQWDLKKFFGTIFGIEIFQRLTLPQDCIAPEKYSGLSFHWIFSFCIIIVFLWTFVGLRLNWGQKIVGFFMLHLLRVIFLLQFPFLSLELAYFLN